MEEWQPLEPWRGEWKVGELLSEPHVLVRSADGPGTQAYSAKDCAEPKR